MYGISIRRLNEQHSLNMTADILLKSPNLYATG